jgi:hypothetical protein
MMLFAVRRSVLPCWSSGGVRGQVAFRLLDLPGVSSPVDSLPATFDLRQDLTTGRETPSADVAMNTASVIKMPVMTGLSWAGNFDGMRARCGRRKCARSGWSRPRPGLNPTVRDLIRQMIITSDNTATDIMIAATGLDRVNAMLDSLGYGATRLRMTTGDLFKWIWVLTDSANAVMSAREVFERGFPGDTGVAGRIFRIAEDSTYWLGTMTARETGRILEDLEPAAGRLGGTAEMLDMLRQQFCACGLQRLQFKATIGHKIGDIPRCLATTWNHLRAVGADRDCGVRRTAEKGIARSH